MLELDILKLENMFVVDQSCTSHSSYVL